MKIAMIGAGAAGSVFAAYLKRGGAEVTLVDRYKAHMDAVSRDGLRFSLRGETEVLTGFTCAESADAIGIMDMVILMVKATQTEALLPSLQRCIGENTIVVSLQNGLDNDRILSKAAAPEQILCGFGKIGTELPEPGFCVSKPESGVVMRFGPVKESALTREGGLLLQDCFLKGGCEARYEEDIRPYIWRKAISNAGYNTLCAVSGLRVGELLSDANGRDLLLTVWKEACDVAAAAGIGDFWAEMQEELPRLQSGFSDYYPSMAQDLCLRRRKTEIEHLNGAIVRYGKSLGVPTPYNEMLTSLVKLKESFLGG